MFVEKIASGGYRFGMSFTDARTGKSRRVSVVMPKNNGACRREAEQILNERIEKINSELGSASTITLKRLTELYIAAITPQVKPTTLRRNAQKMTVICRLLGDDTLVAGLTARYVSQRFAASGRTNGTLNEDLIRFKAFMRWAYKNDYLEDVKWLDKLDPLPDTSAKEKNREKYLEGEELQRLLPELTVERNRLMIAFLALSGLRIGEAIALNDDDVDIQQRVIHVTKTYDHAGRQISKGAKTYASNRDVYMQDELYELCGEIRRFMKKEALRSGFRTDLFFHDESGNTVPYARLNKYFAQKCQAVVGRRLTLHSLRHTHASLLFEAGVPIAAVAARLGHADSKVTREIYLHVTKKVQERYNEQVRGVRFL